MCLHNIEEWCNYTIIYHGYNNENIKIISQQSLLGSFAIELWHGTYFDIINLLIKHSVWKKACKVIRSLSSILSRTNAFKNAKKLKLQDLYESRIPKYMFKCLYLKTDSNILSKHSNINWNSVCGAMQDLPWRNIWSAEINPVEVWINTLVFNLNTLVFNLSYRVVHLLLFLKVLTLLTEYIEHLNVRVWVSKKFSSKIMHSFFKLTTLYQFRAAKTNIYHPICI